MTGLAEKNVSLLGGNRAAPFVSDTRVLSLLGSIVSQLRSWRLRQWMPVRMGVGLKSLAVARSPKTAVALGCNGNDVMFGAAEEDVDARRRGFNFLPRHSLSIAHATGAAK